MNAEAKSDQFYLGRLLEPLSPWLNRPDVTDIFINRFGEVWIEYLTGQVVREELPSLGHVQLDRLARQIAAFSSQGISRAHPLLAATLPDGARIQVVLPPATRGEIAVAIRKHVVADISLADYEAQGAFPSAEVFDSGGKRDRELQALFDARKIHEMLALAVRQRRNILVSGGTSTGKTTFLNALLREVPLEERLILIEDTPELRIRHDNSVGLIAVRGNQGEAQVSANDLLVASLRLRPDRIILGEVRGAEAFTFLRAVNTGHPGSMTSVHADSPDRAIEQLALLVLQGGTQLRRSDVVDYVASVIDVYVQLERGPGGRRVSDVRLRLLIGARGAASPTSGVVVLNGLQ